jgi:import inner membrane translocase subunit TIM10
MTNVCHRKCVPPKYRDGELSKGESICIDRCVAKYFEIHDRIGKKLTTLTQAQAQQVQADPLKNVGTY